MDSNMDSRYRYIVEMERDEDGVLVGNCERCNISGVDVEEHVCSEGHLKKLKAGNGKKNNIHSYESFHNRENAKSPVNEDKNTIEIKGDADAMSPLKLEQAGKNIYVIQNTSHSSSQIVIHHSQIDELIEQLKKMK